MNRLTSSGKKLGPEQCIPVMEALKDVTVNAAYQIFEEKRKGSLEIGKLADLVVLSANPLKVDPMKIKNIQVLATIKEGKTVYQKKSPPPPPLKKKHNTARTRAIALVRAALLGELIPLRQPRLRRPRKLRRNLNLKWPQPQRERLGHPR